MDTQRTILWLVFGLSLIMLWDRWQAYQRPAVTAPAPAAPTAPAAKAPGGVPTPSGQAATAAAVPSPPGAAPAAGAERVKIRTDLIWAEIDPMGAVLVRAELPTQKLALDWTEQGWPGCWA